MVIPNDLHTLADSVTAAIEGNEDGSDQKEQVELLTSLEDKFRKNIIKTAQAKEAYKKFILMIVVEHKNLLLAKPYFRERSGVFNEKISPAIRTGNIHELQKYRANYLLIKFIKDNWRGAMPERAEKLLGKIEQARKVLIENNMPLAINRAKLFFRKTPENHLSLIDLIGICSIGLISGIDKWCGPYSKVFRSTCIGYMTGSMIEHYSKTQVHMYPSDKAMLYRANSMRHRMRVDDIKTLSYLLQKEFPDQSDKASVEYLSELLGTTSVASAEAPLDTDKSNKKVFLKDYIQDNKADVEESFIENDAMHKMLSMAKELPVINQKVLRLKGVKL